MKNRRPRGSSARLGFTIIEAVVAILLLSVGAIALASTAAWSARLASDGRALQRQTERVQHVVDSLRTVPCAAIASGSATASGTTVSWSVIHTASVAEVAVVSPPPARRVSPFALRFIVPCE